MAPTVKKYKRDIPQIESINRISKIPVVETGVQYAKIVYGKIKNSNALFQWSLDTVEDGIQLAIDKSLIAVPIIEMPLTIVDSIVCKSLDTIEQRVPAINYPPETLLNMTKDLVSTKIVQPVIKRADSVKQFSVQEASKYGELAASRLDTALDVADQYVDKYLPDASDNTDSKADSRPGDSKAIQTIEHVNRLSRKLQRRLTKRTIAEAKALRKQGADTFQVLVHLLDLAIKDPKQFIETLKTAWKNLSKDEPENQIPPDNLEQLIAMLTRESARRFVHLTNFTIAIAAKMPTYTSQSFHILNEYTSYMLDYINKTANIEQAKTAAITKARTEIEVLYDLVLQIYSQVPQLVERILTRMNRPVTSQQTPKACGDGTHNAKQNNGEGHGKQKKEEKTNNDNDSQKEVANSSKKETKQELKKKKSRGQDVASKDPPRSTQDENSNSAAIENGGPPNENN